ncbi:VOC family protein, partial [Mycolicibacterium farcinogenes]|nr:VOC family protein [Mycolicibacterium farcinogenes]
MTEPRTYPAGVPCWVDTDQQDVPAAQDFYGRLFGWTFENVLPDDVQEDYLLGDPRRQGRRGDLLGEDRSGDRLEHLRRGGTRRRTAAAVSSGGGTVTGGRRRGPGGGG